MQGLHNSKGMRTMEADSDLVDYIRKLIKDSGESSEAEYLLRMAVAHNIQTIPFPELIMVSDLVLSTIERYAEDDE